MIHLTLLDDNSGLSSQFNNPFQSTALWIVGKEYAELALQFSNYDQIAILKRLEKYDENSIKLALLFTNHNQFLAFEELSQNTTNINDISSALAFTVFFQVEALKIVKDISLALKFKTPLLLDVLKKLGKDHSQLALKFNYLVQYEALDIVEPTLALKITTNQQLHALSLLGSLCFDEALKASEGDITEVNRLSDECSTRLAEHDLKLVGHVDNIE